MYVVVVYLYLLYSTIIYGIIYHTAVPYGMIYVHDKVVLYCMHHHIVIKTVSGFLIINTNHGHGSFNKI